MYRQKISTKKTCAGAWFYCYVEHQRYSKAHEQGCQILSTLPHKTQTKGFASWTVKQLNSGVDAFLHKQSTCWGLQKQTNKKKTLTHFKNIDLLIAFASNIICLLLLPTINNRPVIGGKNAAAVVWKHIQLAYMVIRRKFVFRTFYKVIWFWSSNLQFFSETIHPSIYCLTS